jgi:hypothetical protein
MLQSGYTQLKHSLSSGFSVQKGWLDARVFSLFHALVIGGSLRRVILWRSCTTYCSGDDKLYFEVYAKNSCKREIVTLTGSMPFACSQFDSHCYLTPGFSLARLLREEWS